MAVFWRQFHIMVSCTLQKQVNYNPHKLKAIYGFYIQSQNFIKQAKLCIQKNEHRTENNRLLNNNRCATTLPLHQTKSQKLLHKKQYNHYMAMFSEYRKVQVPL